MKKRELPLWFHSTARLLGLRFDDTDRRAATYPGDGRICIARLRKLSHVVHEIAHYVDSLPWRRHAPNYGLATDPDGGPTIPYAGELDKQTGDWCEVHATFLTILLLGEADLPWRRQATETRWCDPRSEEEAEEQEARIESVRYHYKARGIDIFDVLAHFRAGAPNR